MDSSTNWFLALKIWGLAVLKFFDVVLKFELPNAQFLNFPKNSAQVLINGDCVVSHNIMMNVFYWILLSWNKLNYESTSIFKKNPWVVLDLPAKLEWTYSIHEVTRKSSHFSVVCYCFASERETFSGNCILICVYHSVLIFSVANTDRILLA